MKREDGKGNILIVDDEKNALKVLSAILKDLNYEVFEAISTEEARHILMREEVDTVITDIRMPGEDGFDLFEYIKEHFPDLPVIFLTAYGTIDSAVKAMADGAFFYFVKPPDYDKLKVILEKAVEQKRLKDEIASLRTQLESSYGFSNIIGRSPAMQHIFKMVEAIKDSSISVLITGETGTGKELLANAIHYTSKRHYRPFVAVNCAAIPSELLESEFFGHEKGAFTGAVSRRIGKFEEAHTGTLFLDEIGELELPLQAKILRAIQEKEIVRVGGNKKIKIDVRLIASTNRDLAQDVKEKRFRADLYYRLNVVEIKLPPLRERKADIPLLVAHFMDKFSQREKKQINSISPQVMDAFMNYSWPGNLRELENVMERAVVFTKGNTIQPAVIPDEIMKCASEISFTHSQKVIKPLKEVEQETIRRAMEAFNGNKSKVAKALGITRKALYSRLKEMGYK